MPTASDLNAIFREFATAFVGSVASDVDVAFPDRVPRARLCGSLESLHLVDAYLAYVHKHRRRISDRCWSITVLRVGAYVGEVIRHAAPAGTIDWIDYDDYMAAHPTMRPLIPERTAATCAFLLLSTGYMSMPLNKLARFIA